MDILLTEKQIKNLNSKSFQKKKVSSLIERWEKLNNSDRIFVLEYIEVLKPEKKGEINSLIKKVKNKTLNEEWYHTILGVVGWLDPTGLADILNGVLYMKEGDYLFGFLSLISAVPYVGDIVAKPMQYALKSGGTSAKELNKIMSLSKAGKSIEASEELSKLVAKDATARNFVSGVSNVSGKIEGVIEKIPAGPLGGLKNTILEWISLFKGTKASTSVGKLSSEFKTLSKAEQLSNLKELKRALSAGPFSGYVADPKFFSWKNLWGGMPRFMGNKSTRILMRKTKWYLGLLDYLGIGNFVGPDELETRLGTSKYQESIEKYNQTQEAEDNLKQDFGTEDVTDEIIPKKQKEKESNDLFGSFDPISILFKLL